MAINTKYQVIYPVTGQVLYAFPIDRVSYPLSSYATHRVLMTETSKLYEGTIDLSKSSTWAVFLGASTPTDYNAALFQDTFTTAANIAGTVAVNITPASFSNLNRGTKSQIVLYYKETKTVVIPVFADYTAIPIRFVVEDANKTNVYTKADIDLVKTATTVSVLIDTTVTDHATYKRFTWSIRRASNEEVLVYGTLDVDYAAF